VAKDLPALNDTLKAKGQPAISPPPEKVAVNDDTANFPGGGGITGQNDRDGPAAKITVPADFRILH